MVALTMAVHSQKHSSKAHTVGELDAITNQGLYLSPTHNKSPGMDNNFIPAFKPPSARRLPMTDAFNSEAQQLKEAELDLRTGSKYERVFGNTLFEGVPDTASAKSASGAIKMNSFFAEPGKQASLPTSLSMGHAGRSPHESSRENTPERPHPGGGLAARRNASVTNASGRIHSNLGPNPALQTSGTAVQAFNDADDLPVVARPVLPTSLSTTTYSVWESQLKQLIATGRREEAVRIPAVPGCLVRCYVKRVKSFFSTHCCFQVYLDNTDVFLLAARRRKKSKTSSYVVSLDLDDLKRDTDNCMGKLKANFVGTEYVLWGRLPQDGLGDERNSPSSPTSSREQAGDAKKGYNREELVINFKQTALNIKGGPRTMYVAVPDPKHEMQSQEGASGTESLSHMLELAKKRELPPYLEKKVSIMSTKLPEYDQNLKTYTLDFQGRVKEASVKNFQLVAWDHNTDRTSSELILQFGKIQDDVYALDFTYPFNVQQAFGLALATIDTKLCYTI